MKWKKSDSGYFIYCFGGFSPLPWTGKGANVNPLFVAWINTLSFLTAVLSYGRGERHREKAPLPKWFDPKIGWADKKWWDWHNLEWLGGMRVLVQERWTNRLKIYGGHES